MDRINRLGWLALGVGGALAVFGTAPAWGAKARAAVELQHPQAIRDPQVDPKLSPAQRARVQRAVAIKKKQDLSKYIKDMVTAEQSAASKKENAK